MDAEQSVIIERVKCIFDSFLLSNANAVYFEKLITHLAAKENAYVLQAPFMLEWVDRCITMISADFNSVNPKVVSFLMHLCGLLTRNEWILIQIKEYNIIERLMSIIESNMSRINPSMKLGSIRLLSALGGYSLGLVYIRRTKSWRFLIDYCNKDHTLYVVREARQLLYELLYKFSVKTHDEQTVLDILNAILKPIHDNVFEERAEQITICVEDTQLQHKLSASLDLLSYILQQTLESEERTKIAHLCEVHHNFEITIWKLSEIAKNQYFLERILTVLSSFYFAHLLYEEWDQRGQIPPENFNKFGVAVFNMMRYCCLHHDCLTFIKLAELNHILWKKLGKRAPKEIQIANERVSFENQLISFHLMPVLFLLRSKEFHDEELFSNYVMKLLDLNCEQSLRICYTYRDILFDSTSKKLLAELAYKSIHGMLAMENVMDRDQAVLVFQAIIYALKEYVFSAHATTTTAAEMASGSPSSAESSDLANANSKRSKSTELITQNPNVLYAALIGLQKLIQRYRITWKESIETICVVNCVAYILDNPNLVSRSAVQALKLLQLSIEHFLSPNMALLVDNLQGSGLVCLGPIMIKRCLDTAWEVRDSTLELITSCAGIARLKFPAFQKFLADYNICKIVYDMAKNDSEPYVRASAFKCLSEMMPINMIWENALSKFDLIEHIFYVLHNDTEGIVRKEAICTLAKIYKYRKIPTQYTDMLYSTLAHCVVADLHWEVKVGALHFWELEIEHQFTNQGMIDGTFPTVTFSKENKKIVTLTAKEINLRIIKVFNELSQRGCLGVILKCLNDDCDLEVIRAAVCMVHRLLQKLSKYDYESLVDNMEVNSNHMDHSPILSNAMHVDVVPANNSTTIASNSDAIIDGILESQDINLLIAAYETQLQLNGEVHAKEKNSIDVHFYKHYASVGVKEFLATINGIDMNQLLHNHQQWLLCSESFDSLLDDIMFAIQPKDETIIADCY